MGWTSSLLGTGSVLQILQRLIELWSVNQASNPHKYENAAQADVYGSGFDITEVYLGNEIAPGSFAWLVPLGEKRALVGLTTKKECTKYLKKLLNKIKTEKDITETKNLQRSHLPLTVIPKGYSERILVVGEAAG